MKRIKSASRASLLQRYVFLTILAGVACLSVGCTKAAAPPKAAPSRPSDIKVEVRDGGPIVVTTSSAEFQMLPSGFLQATLLKEGKRLTLDEPGVGSAAGSDYIVHEGKDLEFVPDFGSAKTLDAIGKLGRGKRVEISAHPLAPAGMAIERTTVIETYDDFPNIALVSIAYKNTGTTDFQIDQAIVQQHHFSAKQADAKAQPFDEPSPLTSAMRRSSW